MEIAKDAGVCQWFEGEVELGEIDYGSCSQDANPTLSPSPLPSQSLRRDRTPVHPLVRNSCFTSQIITLAVHKIKLKYALIEAFNTHPRLDPRDRPHRRGGHRTGDRRRLTKLLGACVLDRGHPPVRRPA